LQLHGTVRWFYSSQNRFGICQGIRWGCFLYFYLLFMCWISDRCISHTYLYSELSLIFCICIFYLPQNIDISHLIFHFQFKLMNLITIGLLIAHRIVQTHTHTLRQNIISYNYMDMLAVSNNHWKIHVFYPKQLCWGQAMIYSMEKFVSFVFYLLFMGYYILFINLVV
jgi:hypothetical protein